MDAKCSKGWADRCAHSKTKRCSCACRSANHGTKSGGNIQQSYQELGNTEKNLPWQTQDEFYSNNDRKKSGEVDYGVWWFGASRYPSYRITFIVDTGEFYAHCAGTDKAYAILGSISGGREAAENLMKGWADVCGSINSLSWARSKF